MPLHTVRQGESIISLSRRYGVPADKILNHPDNRRLSQRRRDQGILFPEDQLTIPEIELREELCATDRRHTFRCTNRNAFLRVRFMKKDNPRSDEAYVLRAGNRDTRGNLDGDGWLEARIPADVEEVSVFLGEGGRKERFEFRVGHLDPISELRGVQQRLNNLGFACGEESDETGDTTSEAIRSFQSKNGMTPTGELDDAIRNRLREVYGS
jgi:hypothetical protein